MCLGGTAVKYTSPLALKSRVWIPSWAITWLDLYIQTWLVEKFVFWLFDDSQQTVAEIIVLKPAIYVLCLHLFMLIVKYISGFKEGKSRVWAVHGTWVCISHILLSELRKYGNVHQQSCLFISHNNKQRLYDVTRQLKHGLIFITR